MFRNALFLALGLLASGGASATETYVCTINVLSPGAAGYLGTEGALTASLYSGPRCTGSYRGFGALCSAEHSSPSCAANVSHSSSALLLSAQLLQSAMERGFPVSSQGRRCNGGLSYTCWGNFIIGAP